MKKQEENEKMIFGVSMKGTLEKVPGVVENLFKKSQDGKSTISICSLNPEILLKASTDRKFRNVLNSFDEKIIDGFGVQLVSFIKGFGFFGRFAGADLAEELLDFAKEKNLRVGAVIAKDGLSSKEEVENFLRKKTGSFFVLEKGRAKRDEAMCQIDNKNFFLENREILEGAQILFVFLGAPKQEFFLSDLKETFYGSRIGICAGGTIDFWTKKKIRAPKIIRKIGLEWLWRFANQPNRLLRIWDAVIVFPIKALLYKKMKMPNLGEIDKLRKQGFRPQAVGCFVNTEEKKVFLFFDEKYGIWQFPQGGIENKEEPADALKREMAEELGKNFVGGADLEKILLVSQKSVQFPPDKHGLRKLSDDNGNILLMRGKWYYFFAIPTKANSFEKHLDDSEFQDWRLLDYNGSINLAKTIYQQGKRRITIEILNNLKESELIE